MGKKIAKSGSMLAPALAAAAALFFAASCATQGGVIEGERREEQEDVQEEKAAQEESEAVCLLAQALEGKTWVLSGILFDGAFIPMHPAHSAGNVLVFNKDGTFSTTAARRIMSGTWQLASPKAGDPAPPDAAIAMARTALEGEREDDPDADKFQEAYLSAFEEARALAAHGNTFMLYDAAGRHILSFILNNPAW